MATSDPTTVTQITYMGTTMKVPVYPQSPLKNTMKPDLRPPIWQMAGSAAYRSANSFGSSPMVGLRPKAPLMTSQSTLHQKEQDPFWGARTATNFFDQNKRGTSVTVQNTPKKKSYERLGGVRPTDIQVESPQKVE